MVGVLLQVGFWVTPIFWDINMMSTNIQFYLKLNPVYYIVQGYRESVIFAIPFWNHPLYTVYFWCITVGIFLAGLFVFYKLKPQFPDVL
jgi:ABC-type polysaccharide/polyol phosphate export permease